MTPDVEQTVQAIKGNAQRLGLTWRIQYATVQDGSNAAAVTVTFDGDPTADASATPPAVSLLGAITAGQRVAVLSVPPDGAYVIGILTTQPSCCLVTFVREQESAQTTTSAGYVNISGASPDQFTYTKIGADSDIKVEAHIQFFVTTAATTAVFALTNGTQIVEICRQPVNTALAHIQTSGVVRFTGVPAGTQTMNVQWARLAGAGTLAVNSEDTFSFALTEVDPL